MEAASSLFRLALHTLAANSNKMVAGPLRGFLTRTNERVCPVNKGVGVKEMVETVVYSVGAVPLGCQPPSASLYARTASILVIACLPSIRLTRFLFRAGRAFLDSVRPGHCLRCHRSIVRGTATLLRCPLPCHPHFYSFYRNDCRDLHPVHCWSSRRFSQRVSSSSLA